MLYKDRKNNQNKSKSKIKINYNIIAEINANVKITINQNNKSWNLPIYDISVDIDQIRFDVNNLQVRDAIRMGSMFSIY